MAGDTEVVHATAVAVGDRAVLIRGPSGSGKSDLALRCLALAPSTLVPHSALLVADDQVLLARAGDQIRATAPEALRGLIEVRGIGIVAVSCADLAYVALVADLVPADKVERMPEAGLSTRLLGIDVPLVRLAPFEPSAAVKLLVRLMRPRGGTSPA